MLAVLVLAAVALVGLGAGFLMSVAGGASDVTTTERPPSTGVSSRGVPATAPPTAPRPTVPAGSEIEPGRTQDLGFMLGARSAGNKINVAFDRVQLLRGKAAQAYARKHRISQETAKRGLIVNENPKTRNLVLAPDVRVLGAVRLAASSDLEQVPLQTLLDALDQIGGSLPLELKYDRLGYVVEVREKILG